MATRTSPSRPSSHPSSRAFQPRLLPVALAVALLLGGPVLAAPVATQLPVVAPGGAQINATVGTATGGTNPTLAVTQSQSATNRALVEWQSFSVGSSAKVNFVQPNAQSILINRVTGSANGVPISEIYGGISANGRVFLVNPTGIVFGPSAQVNVGSLVATTLDLTADMTANSYAGFINGGAIGFADAGTGLSGTSLTIQEATNPAVPQIVAGEGGSILLLGRDGVEHAGSISAPRGSITIGNASAATLSPVTTSGFIQVLSATPTPQGGGVFLDAGSQTVAAGGTIRVGAVSPEEGQRSDTVFIGGTLSTDSSDGPGGSIVVDAGNSTISQLQIEGATLSANSSTGTAGTITLGGRFISLSSGRTPVRISADGSTGGGSIAAGGTGTASLTVADGSVISADATGNGNGGTVSLRAMLNQAPGGTSPPVARTDFGVLEMYGALSARGGAAGGNGGSVETSGTAMTTSLADANGVLSRQGSVDAGARAAGGKAGTWSLDPFDVTISDSATIGVEGSFSPTAPGANVRAADISAALDAGTSVEITTGTAATGTATGSITMAPGAAIVRSTGTARTSLTLRAHDSISLGDGSSISVAAGAGAMDINLLSDLDGSGSGVVSLVGTLLATGGGNLTLSGGTDPATGFARGNGQQSAVSIVRSGIDTSGAAARGDVVIRGAGNAATSESGVEITGSTVLANNIGILGLAGHGSAVRLDGNSLRTDAGTIDVRGVATRSAGGGEQAVGLDIGTLDIAAGIGSVVLAGRGDDGAAALGTDSAAVGLRYGTLTIASAANSSSRVTLAGQSANSTGGVGLQQFSPSGGKGLTLDAGEVVIGAATDNGTALSLGAAPVIRVSGSANLRPLGVAADGSLSEQTGTPILIATAPPTGNTADFVIESRWLQPVGGTGGLTADKGIVVGSSSQGGLITVADQALDLPATSLTLQNQGGESLGILLGGQNRVRDLGLLTSGNVSQTGPITVDRLVIQGNGGSTVTLTNAQNQIGTLAFDPPGSLSVVTAGNLVIDSASAARFSTDGAAFETLAITDSQGGASALLRAGGSVTLNRSIAMDNEIGTLDIVAPTQVIFGAGASLSAGSYWRVWTAAVSNPPVAGGAVSYYGCSFGDTQVCSLSGIALPGNGQQLLFPTQPTLTVAADPASGQPGAIPPLTYTVNGLLNGDNAATVVTGALATAATATSPAGTYAITQGTVTSPTGYVITFQGANLVLGAVPVANLDILGITREALQSRFQSQFESDVYGRNLAQPYICTAASLIRGLSADDKQADPLAAEWGKVRNQPQLSGCLDVSDGGSCSAF